MQLLSLVLMAVLMPSQQVCRTAAAGERHGLPGARPGSERWLVTFADRSFTLEAFAKAVREGSTDRVAEIVTGLEAKVVADQAAFVEVVKAAGGRVVDQWWIVNGCAIEVPHKALAGLQRHPRVVRLDPDEIARPTAIKDSTNARNHASDAANTRGLIGTGVAIAVMDSGVDIHVPATLRPHIAFYPAKGKGKGIGGSRIVQAVAVGKQPADDVVGHGTSVAGVAAAEPWKTTAADRGHAPGAEIASYSIANDLQGNSDYATIVKAWQRIAAEAVKYRIKVANNAYSGSPDPLHLTQQALDSVALNVDVLPVVSAGNQGGSTWNSQSAANGLSVGATRGGGVKTVWIYSSRGPLYKDALRYYPDLVANGVDTVTPLHDAESSNKQQTGTSMSSAQVSGAAALFRAQFPKHTALETRAAILATTEDILRQNRAAPFRGRNAFGLGYLRDDLLTASVASRLIQTQTLTTTTKTRTVVYPVKAGKAYAVVVAWNRLLTTNNSAKWSNLDVQVYSGSRLLATAATPRNLTEKAVFLAPVTGNVNIVVTGKSLSQRSVPFAIVATEVEMPFFEGEVHAYGKGCAGTSPLPTVSVPLPAFAARSFGNAAVIQPLGSTPHRLQMIVAANELPASFRATGIAFRHDEVRFSPIKNYSLNLEVDVGYAASDPAKMSSTFAANVSGKLTKVFPAKSLNLPDLVARNTNHLNWIVQIPFTVPFLHTTTTPRSLLVDFRLHKHSKGSNYAFYFVDATYDATTVRVSRVLGTSANATTGTVSIGLGPIIGFSQPSSIRAVPDLAFQGPAEIGKTLSLVVSKARKSTVALMWIGASDRNWLWLKLPFDLSPFGAKGCWFLASYDIPMAFTTQADGTLTVPVSIPNNRVYVRLPLFFQLAIYDVGANALNLAFTNGLKVVIGG